MAATTPRSDDTLELREEELVANTRSVETGQVRLGKEVVSEERTIDVPTTHEEVVIERTPVDRRLSDQPIDTRGDTISVPVRAEQVDVEKRAVVYEEVGVDKRTVQDTQRVSETVRREEAVIDKDGDVEVDGKLDAPRPLRP